MFLRSTICALVSAGVLFCQLALATRSAPELASEPNSVDIPQVQNDFYDDFQLRNHIDTLSGKLSQLRVTGSVSGHSLPPAFRPFAARNLHEILQSQSHLKHLLHLGTSDPHQEHAFLFPYDRTQEVLAVRQDPHIAHFGLITVARGNPATIKLKGFVRMEGVENRNLLAHAIQGADGWPGSGLPFSHDLDSLLQGRIHGF